MYRQGKYKNATWGLDYMARSMLKKAKIAQNIDRAKVLRTLVDQSSTKGSKNRSGPDEWSQLFRLLSDCFEVLIDDLIVASAFELYAKRTLLSRGYCVHNISAPEALVKAQQRGAAARPIHVRTIRAVEAKGEKVSFQKSTLKLSVLMKKAYADRLHVPANAMKGLAEVQERRNLIHFHTHYTWNVTHDLLALVEYLDEVIPIHKSPRKQA